MKVNNYLALGGIVASLAGCSSADKERVQPNILLINIDDLGWADMTFQGSEYYQTPNIDRLRSEGLFFTNAYACAANSAPSRASLMTGFYAPRHGVYTVNPPDRGDAKDRKLISAPNSETPDSSYTILAERLRDGGYSTFHLGKWHLGKDAAEQGFDVNIGGNLKGHPKSYFSPYKNPNLPDGEDGEFLTDRLTDEAIKLLSGAKDSDKPFFMYFATYAVHTPLQPKPELKAKYDSLPSTDDHNNSKYAALIESTDTNLGRLLDYLQSSGLDKNTVVVFISDNGGLYSVSKQHPLRAGKGSFYEGGIRTPMIVRWNGVTAQNSSNDTPVSQISLYPTLLEIAGISADTLGLDGHSILPLFKGEECESTEPLYWHFPAYLEGGGVESTDSIFRSRPVSVIRDGDWKLIYNYESGLSELYNLRDDISEKNDLSTAEPAITDSLHAELFEWLRTTDAPTSFALNPSFELF